MCDMSITIATSNVNGIRAADRKHIGQWVDSKLPEVWCMQEVRAPQSAIDPIFDDFAKRYVAHNKIKTEDDLFRINDICEIKGRAGVALLTTLPVIQTRIGLPGLSEPVDTGRWIEADVKTPDGHVITVVCIYVHSGMAEDEVKMTQKFRFLDAMMLRLKSLRDEAAQGGKQAVLCGDFNIAHTAIDIKNAKANVKHAGFMPSERAYIDRWIDDYDYVDVMRDLAGDIQGPYTWWSQRGRAFDNNVGWRLDYQFATPELADTAQGFTIDKAQSYDTRWSDHAALDITYEV